MNRHLIAPSILAANFLNLAKDITLVNESEADWFHLDVMDGNFVPNISFGPNIIQQISTLSKKTLDVHLMIENPGQYIDKFVQAGADYISVHEEACSHLHRVIHQIKEAGPKAGVAINPHTPVSAIEMVLEDVDLVVVMSVNPGFGGQKFIYNVLEKIRQLDKIRIEKNLSFLIEVDGGVGLQNAEKVLQAGADVLVAGSAVFKSENPLETISKMKAIETVKAW